MSTWVSLNGLSVRFDEPSIFEMEVVWSVRFVLKLLQAGDNGDVQIEVFQGQKRIKTLVSQFSLDTLVYKPPAVHRWAWLDGDVFPDLLLEFDAKTFFVGSRDGLIHL